MLDDRLRPAQEYHNNLMKQIEALRFGFSKANLVILFFVILKIIPCSLV